MRVLVIFLGFFIFSQAANSADYQSLKVKELNVRSGPGRTYPVLWQYNQKYTPVRVVNHYKDWVHIQDYTGQKGWVHKTSLSSNRTVLILKDTYLYSNASDLSQKKAVIKPISFAFLDHCQFDYCAVTIEGVRGYLSKKTIWGF